MFHFHVIHINAVHSLCQLHDMTEIVPYEPAYRHSCLTIFESNQPRFFSEPEKKDFEEWLDSGALKDYFVLLLDGEAIACGGIFFEPERRTAGLSWGMVHATYHGKGYGKLFTGFRVGLIRQKYPGFRCVIDTSHHTEKFYEKFGFRTVSIEQDGYAPGLHKHWMEIPAEVVDAVH
jgi:GNAT superfamily N-acetyltransferase